MGRQIYKGGTEYIFNDGAGQGGIPTYGNPLPNHAGFAPRVDTGYDIEAVRPPRVGLSKDPKTAQIEVKRNSELYEEFRKELMKGANGMLHDGEWYVKFFINSISIDFGLAGSTGQSKYTRDFYPRNIIMPSIIITAQVLNQEDYGTLVEFVHQAQQKAVATTKLTQLEIAKGGLDISEEGRRSTQFEVPFDDLQGPSMKGVHEGMIGQGFVPNIGRAYKQGEYVPVFQFPFTVAQFFGTGETTNGFGELSSNSEPEQATWKQIIEGIKATGIPLEATKAPKEETPKPTAPKLTPEEEKAQKKGRHAAEENKNSEENAHKGSSRGKESEPAIG